MSTARTSKFGSLSVTQKVLGVVGFCLAMLVGVVTTATVQMASIGGEIESIAENDIPLTEILTKVTTHQLEQAINLERALRYGEVIADREMAEKGYRTALDHFTELNVLVDKEIKEAEVLAEEAIGHARTEAERKEFEHILSTMKHIEVAHVEFAKHAQEIFRLIEAGDAEKAIQLAEAIKVEEDKLDHELEALLEEIEAFTGRAAETAAAHERTALYLLLAMGCTALTVGIAASVWMVRRYVSRPLTEVVGALDALGNGDTSAEVTVYADDEIGAVAKSFTFFRDKTIEAEEAKKAQAAKAKEARIAALREIADELEKSVKEAMETVAGAATQLESTAQGMSATAEETSRQATGVSAASEQASVNVQTVATAAEELASSIGEVTRQVSHSNQIAQDAVTSVDATNETVAQLHDAAQRIGDVVNLINDIAEQTNLLALNATIEAARAGEAGKGFAVVATEVKSLASQTSKATEEISQQIDSMQTATTEAVQAIKQIGGVIGKVSEIATAISAAVEQQSVATTEIAQNATQASSGTREMASNITGVQQAAQETGRSATEVLDASGSVSSQAEAMRDQIANFVERLRAALKPLSPGGRAIAFERGH